MNLETIKSQLVLPNTLKASCAEWCNYGVVQEPNIFFQLNEKKKWKIKIRTGIQEGIAVGSKNYEIEMSVGSGALPSRKWNEFKTEKDAGTFYLIEVIEVFEKKNIDKSLSFSLQPAIDAMMNFLKLNADYRGKQFELF